MISIVSLETALKLKKAGWTKETHLFHFKSPLTRIEDKINAPNTDELLEELPETLIIWKSLGAYDVGYRKSLTHEDSMHSRNSELIEALASMWLYLKKEGIIK